MTASDQTVSDTLKVLRLHLRDEQIVAILSDLRAVRGNASFMETVARLLTAARAK